MSKFTELFESEESRKIRMTMEFNQNKRSFEKYYRELDASIKNFSKMAQDAEHAGNHENALSCAKFVLKLQKTQTKVQGLLQRFEMMNAMQKLTDVQTTFMKSCAKMGIRMDKAINLKDMWKNTAKMELALNKLDAMSEQMEMAFETIDSGMNNSEGAMTAQDEENAEAGKLLEGIMRRDTAVNFPVQAAPVAQGESAAAQPAVAAPASEEDDVSERLRRMMEELKD